MRMAIAALLLSLSGHPAFAWETYVDGPDVFGETKVHAVASGAQASLVVHCSTEGSLMLALTFAKKEFDEVPELEGTLFISVSDAPPTQLPATLREWNNTRGGFVASEREALITVVTAIRDARGSIKVGADIAGNRRAETFGSRGSTAAMKKVFQNCKLDID